MTTVNESIRRRNEAQTVHPICPKCGESSQIQLVSWMIAPFGWRCRTCKTKFEQEVSSPDVITVEIVDDEK